MEINCLIVDDEPAAVRVVESYVENINHLKIAGICSSAFEAIRFLQEQVVDLIFLDINMPGLSGIDFLKALRNPPLVIVTTAYREYAVESFELEVVDYLHKPYAFERFFKAVQRVEELLVLRNSKNIDAKESGDAKDHIFIKADKKYHKINFADILFVESMGDYSKIITSDQTHLSYLTLKKLTELLPENFIRVHKSFIVQFDKIDLVQGNMLRVSGSDIPIGYSYRTGVYKLLENPGTK